MLHSITAFVIYIIHTLGYPGIGLIVFAESGLLLGFFLPGDSLIFLAGLLAAQGRFNLTGLLLVIFAGGVLGDNLGYFIGLRMGPRVFTKKESLIFNQPNLEKTERFFERYGKLTFLVERFIPVIRVFAPLLGGVGKMKYRIFFIFDLVGVALWTLSITLLGFYLGEVIPNIDAYLLPAVFLVVLVSFIPTLFTYKRRKGV